MSDQWYVARTKPLAEYAAASTLEGSGLQVFAPCVQSHRPRPGHPDTPMFPGYLFLRCDLKRDWASVHRVPQVWGLVRFGGEPRAVPDDVIAALAQRVSAVNEDGGLYTHYRPGDRVRVIFGATESLAQVVQETKSSQARVRVLMEFMGNLVPTQVPWQNLRPAPTDQFTLHERQRAQRRTRGRGRWVQGLRPDPVATVSNGRHGPYNGHPTS